MIRNPFRRTPPDPQLTPAPPLPPRCRCGQQYVASGGSFTDSVGGTHSELRCIPPAPAIPCPVCKLNGQEPRGPIVVPREDGTETVIGRAYGCPHCTAAWFTVDGTIRRFGYHKAALHAHPGQWEPPGGAAGPPPQKSDEQRAMEQRAGNPDRDMPWNRASRR